MELLVGRRVCKIDKKGRVSVPKPFRAPFEGQDFRGVYAFPLFRHAAVFACGEARMKRLLGDIDALDMFSGDADDLSAVILNSAEALDFDPEGRIVLPPAFLEHTGVRAQALFAGRGAGFEIWDPAAFKDHSRAAFERARARGVTLPPSGRGAEENA